MNFKKMGGTFLKGMKKAHKVATSDKTKSTIRKVQNQGAHMQNVATGTKAASTKKIVKKATTKKAAGKTVNLSEYKKMATYASKTRADKEAKFYRTEGARVKIVKYGGKYKVYVAFHK